jgi:exopolyphosphatase/guanosine-5'-triphosphate,3'-diphosphate pyrophosphatase
LSAYLLKRLVQVCHIDQVYFSAYGVREGIIYNQLRSSQKAEDPLLCSSQYFSAQLHARPENYDDLQAWTFSFFENLSPEKKRLYEAVLLLCDMAIYEARHVRSMNAFERILTLPLTGITHAERIWIALATSIRYSGNLNARYLQDHLDLIEPEASYEALVLGQFLRLSQTLSCRKSGILPHVNLMVRDNQLIVSSASHVDYLYGDRVEKYLSNLARSLRLIPRIDQAGHFSLEHVSQ